MLYKFRSKAAGDVIMLGPNGDQVMRVLGRDPAPQGIVEPADLAAAIHAIEAAVAADEAARAGVDGARPADVVSLRQRVWPLIEMFKRALAAGQPVVWGV
jgi:hypothetical protein